MTLFRRFSPAHEAFFQIPRHIALGAFGWFAVACAATCSGDQNIAFEEGKTDFGGQVDNFVTAQDLSGGADAVGTAEQAFGCEAETVGICGKGDVVAQDVIAALEAQTAAIAPCPA